MKVVKTNQNNMFTVLPLNTKFTDAVHSMFYGRTQYLSTFLAGSFAMDKNSLQERRSLHRCKICNQIFTKFEDFLQHTSIHEKKSSSHDKSVDKVSTFDVSMCDISGNKRSNFCNKVANKIEKMLIDQQLNSPAANVPHNAVVSTMQSKRHISFNQVANKVKKISSDEQLKSQGNVSTNVQIYKCTFCNRICPSKKSLFNHKRKHRIKLKKIQMHESIKAKQSIACVTSLSNKNNSAEEFKLNLPQHNSAKKFCNQNEEYLESPPEVSREISAFISRIRKTTELTNVDGKMESANNVKSAKVTISSVPNFLNNVNFSCRNRTESTDHDVGLSPSVSGTSSSTDISENCSNTSLKPRSYQCSLCDRIFTKKQTYVNHKRNHRMKNK